MHTIQLETWLGEDEPAASGSGTPPHDPRLEPRVAKLETSIDFIQRDLTDLHEGVDGAADAAVGTRERLVSIESRLSHMPTKLEMWMGVGAVLVVVGGAVGGALWWLVQQYLGPILVRAVGG